MKTHTHFLTYAVFAGAAFSGIATEAAAQGTPGTTPFGAPVGTAATPISKAPAAGGAAPAAMPPQVTFFSIIKPASRSRCESVLIEKR